MIILEHRANQKNSKKEHGGRDKIQEQEGKLKSSTEKVQKKWKGERSIDPPLQTLNICHLVRNLAV